MCKLSQEIGDRRQTDSERRSTVEFVSWAVRQIGVRFGTERQRVRQVGERVGQSDGNRQRVHRLDPDQESECGSYECLLYSLSLILNGF